MKSNVSLQTSINSQNYAQRVIYAAHVLKSALFSSPTARVRNASPAVVGRRAIPAYEGFAGSPAVTAVNNTTGYAAGERFPGRPAVAAQPASGGYAAVVAIPAIAASPAFEIGAAVPAYSAVPARAEQVEVMPVAAITAVSSPAVKALPGWEDAISIVKTQENSVITAELPVITGVGIVGSTALLIGEITPTSLQATAWLDDSVSANGWFSLNADVPTDTLEQFFYRNALECEHVITDIVRDVNGVDVPCKRIVVTVFHDAGFDLESDSLQLDQILIAAPAPGGT